VELKNDERGWATRRDATVVKRTTNITLCSETIISLDCKKARAGLARATTK